jgi:hypothetical protein
MFLFARRDGHPGRFIAAALALMLVAPAAYAGAIASDTWGEFSFGDAGTLARGCDPADPAGGFCIPSGGTPTIFLDAPAWTFVAAGDVVLTITDAFLSGDQFEVFDFGVSLGLTSSPAGSGLVDCGDDPVVCLGTSGISHGTFALAAGVHAITVRVASSDGGGAGYLLVSGGNNVPEPATLALLVLALAALVAQRARVRTRR